MKNIITILLTLVSLHIKAQYNPYNIRESIAESIEKLNTLPGNVFRVVNKEISGGEFSIPIRVYYPSNQDSLPILFHIHGGAWIAGNLDTHDNICSGLNLPMEIPSTFPAQAKSSNQTARISHTNGRSRYLRIKYR